MYGTIVATAVIAATARHQPPGRVLAATIATLLIFWLAHVYADFLDHGLRQAGFDLKVLTGIAARELSMLAAPALSILFLLLGALGLLDEDLAVRLALWNGVAQLVGWGTDIGRRRGQGWPTAPSAWSSSCSRSCCTDPRGVRRRTRPWRSWWTRRRPHGRPGWPGRPGGTGTGIALGALT